MKLLYLYVKEYGCIIDKEFNFDSNLRFYLDKERRVLIDEEKKILPDDFFEILHYPSDNPVSSVTAIIGKNGSGKTSLARCIGDVVNDFNKSISKVIFSDNEEQKIQINLIM